MFKLELHSDGTSWNVTRDGQIVSTHATIALAFSAKSDLEAATPKVRRHRRDVEASSRGNQGGWMGNRYSGPRRSGC